jgi:hypothetical protein
MSLTHVDPHVSEIVMVWIQSGDLLMVWIQISHYRNKPSVLIDCLGPETNLNDKVINYKVK